MALPGKVGTALQIIGGLGQFFTSRKFGQSVEDLGPISGERPGTATTGGFPGGGLAPPSGDLGQRVQSITNIRFGGGNLTERDVRFIGGQLDASDPGTADDFRRFVSAGSGGIPIDPDVQQVIEAGGRDLETRQRISRETLDRQFEGLGDAHAALESGTRGSQLALRRREQQIMSQLTGSLRKGAADIRLAQAAAFLPVALMTKLRDESLNKFADNSVAEMDMVSGALNARHEQEASQLTAKLTAQGMRPEFIEASLQELRSDQKQQVSDQFTNIRIKHQALRQDLDIKTQQFVGFAVQTAAEQSTRIAEINKGMRELNIRLTQDAQMNLLATDLAIREKELDGKILLADWLRNTKEIFVSEAEFVEGAFSLNAAQGDRELQRMATRFGIDMNRFGQLAAEGNNIINQNIQEDQIAATEKAGDQAFLGGIIGGTTSAVGNIFAGAEA